MNKNLMVKNAVMAGVFAFALLSCKKDQAGSNGSEPNPPSAQNPHLMSDPRLTGEWKNVSVSDINWQTDYGVNGGPQNGSYIDYKINSDGSGTCVKYVTTTEQGSVYYIFQRSSGFFIAKKNGGAEGYYELTYCVTSGIIETSKNGVTTKKSMSGNELYHENDPHSGRDFFPAYNIVTISSGSYTDPHHYFYCNYTDKDGNLITDASGKAKVTSYVDVLQ